MTKAARAAATSSEQLSAMLDAWKAECGDPAVVAAVTLVQEEDVWLRRRDFRALCVYVGGEEDPATAGRAMIQWAEVRKFLDGGVSGSSAALGVLEFACAIARNQFGWSGMGPAHRELLLAAASTALGRPPVTLGRFGRDIVTRTKIALDQYGGHPNGAWSTGEQLAVALVLRDAEHLDGLAYTPTEAAERIAGELMIGRAELNGWLDAVRAAAGVETWKF